MRGVVLTIGLCALLALAGCGSDSSAETVSEEAAARSKPEVPQGPSTNRIVSRQIEEGTGVAAEEGDTLFVHFVGGIYETGEEIESAWVKDNPLSFVLGGGSYLPAFEQGMRGVRVGGRQELIMPTSRKYAPPGSEVGDTLVYVVDLIRVNRPRPSS